MGCGCLLMLLCGASPRFVMLFMWIFTDRLSLAFHSFWAGLAGFAFLPFTSIMYALAYSPVTEVRGIGWLLVGFGVVLDISAWSASGREAQVRYRPAG